MSRAETLAYAYYDELTRSVAEGLKNLLETCHLYQSVEIPAKNYTELLEYCSLIYDRREREHIAAVLAKVPDHPWFPDSHDEGVKIETITRPGLASRDPILKFELLPFEGYCPECERRLPFNPFMRSAGKLDRVHGFATETSGSPRQILVQRYYDQFFVLPYQCQGCRSTPEVFLVGRSKTKLTLAGRLPIEKVECPSYLPKSTRGHYSSAMHAFNVNAVLPALFMLRVLIEQFAFSELRRKNAFDAVEGDRGMNYMEAYSGTLPRGLRESAPSLRVIYDRLSIAMHEAKADEALFHESLQQIHEHFDGRRYFKADN